MNHSRAERARRAFRLQRYRFEAPHVLNALHGNRMENAVVLIVDNEALIRISALQFIEDAGFAVIEARNADEAITILHSRTDIRAVFTDIKMPGSMDGWKLARAIRGRWPPIHLILASALAPNLSEMPANGLFIQKPYTAGQIASALYELFNHDPASGPIIQDSSGNCARIA